MRGETNWQASVIEHRTAWSVALCCLLLILITSLKPDLFSSSDQVSVVAQEDIAAERPKHRAKPIAPRIDAKPKQPALEHVTEVKRPKVVVAAAKPIVKKSTPKKIVTKPAATTVSTPDSGYYVQLGAFKEKPRAQGLVDQLKRQGWSGILSRKSSGLYVVWAGPEKERSKVDKLQVAIEKKMKIKGFIVTQKGS